MTAGRRLPRGVGDRGAGGQGADPLSGHELDQVAPVGPDVGEGARGAAQSGVDAPVVVVGAEQPVLQVAAVDQSEVPRAVGANPGPGLADGRVVAVDEGDGGRPRRRRSPPRSVPPPRRRRGRSASRRRCACPLRARPGPAARGDGSACRCGPRRFARRRSGRRRWRRPCPLRSLRPPPWRSPGSRLRRPQPALRRSGRAGMHPADEPGADDPGAEIADGRGGRGRFDADGAAFLHKSEPIPTFVWLSSRSFSFDRQKCRIHSRQWRTPHLDRRLPGHRVAPSADQGR